MLIIFTAGFPVVIFLLLFMNRKRLQTPSVRAQLGFLYVSFRPNAGEFWEVHELLRKLMLMGALVLIESTKVRMIVALLVCVVSVMSLNYFRPHKNVVVLCVAQVSFLLTSFKYILAIVLDDVAEEEREMLGWVLIVLDVCFVLGSIGCVFAVLYLFGSRMTENIKEDLSTCNDPTLSPLPTSSSRSGQMATRTQVKPRLTSARTKLVNSIHAAIVHHKVVEVQKSSAMHLQTHTEKVLERMTTANRRLQQRLSNRGILKSAAHTTIIEKRIVHSLELSQDKAAL